MQCTGLVRSRHVGACWVRSMRTKLYMFVSVLFCCYFCVHSFLISSFVLFFFMVYRGSFRFQIEIQAQVLTDKVSGAWFSFFSLLCFLCFLIGPWNGHFMCRSIDYESIGIGSCSIEYSLFFVFCFFVFYDPNMGPQKPHKQVAHFCSSLFQLFIIFFSFEGK